MKDPATGQSLTSWIWMSLLAFCCVAAVYFAWERRQGAKAELEQADQLFQQGQKAEALAIYEKHFDYLPEQRKPEILRRIVARQLNLGRREEARKWIERAWEADYSLDTDVEEIRELVDEVKRRHDAKASPRPPEPVAAQKPESSAPKPQPAPKTPSPKSVAREPSPSTVPPASEEGLSERERKRRENLRRTEEAKAAAVARRPETAANMLENALRLRRQGKADEAAKWLLKVVEDYPETDAAENARKQLQEERDRG